MAVHKSKGSRKVSRRSKKVSRKVVSQKSRKVSRKVVSRRSRKVSKSCKHRFGSPQKKKSHRRGMAQLSPSSIDRAILKKFTEDVQKLLAGNKDYHEAVTMKKHKHHHK